MKKKLLTLLAVIVLGMVLVCGVSAEVAEDFAWSLDETTGTLTISGHGEMPYYDGVPWNSDLIQNIVITDGITSIGNGAFLHCSSLTSITIPDSVTSIGMNAFDETPWYDAQPDGLIYINRVLYEYKGEIPDETSIDIKPGTVSISNGAFYGCSSLTSITIPNSVTSIGSDTFSSCSSLTSITIPDSVTSISAWAFRNCSSLTKIVVDNNNPEYSSDEFGILFNKDKTELIQAPRTIRNYVIPNSVTSIGMFAFSGCSSLTDITIPDGVKDILNFAFEDCRSLTSITIPDSVRIISQSAFYGSGLTSIELSDSKLPVTINASAFSGTPWYESQSDGVLYINRILYGYKGEMPEGTTIDVRQGTVTISPNAFYGCTGLTSVTIPDGVLHINGSAFEGCNGLTEIIVPDSVEFISNWAFGGCSSLTSIKLSSNVTKIYKGTFSGCTSLTDVYYAGSEEEWKNIQIEETWNDSLLTATIHFNYTSDPPRSATVLVNGSRVSFPDQQPLLKDSRTLVPARGVFEALGATVGWDDATETVTVSRGDTLVTLTIGQSFITVNGVQKAQDVPAQLINDRTMIPVRAVAEAFGCNVGWDDATYTVTIDA